MLQYGEKAGGEAGRLHRRCIERNQPEELDYLTVLGDANERALGLHASVERRLELLIIARKATDAAFEVRKAANDRRNDRLVRTSNIKVGDYVWAKLIPDADRARKLDAQYSGPWQLITPLGDTEVSFLCNLMGRRVTYKKKHLVRMKPFHQRPLALQPVGQVAQLYDITGLDEEDACTSLCDRRANSDDTAWQYRMLLRDGTLSGWRTQLDILKCFTPSAIDTFHALFELKHGDQMPRHAKRRAEKLPAKLTVEQAMAMFPRGTGIAREGDVDIGETPLIRFGSVVARLIH
eukprot:8003-Heterococcus_DN1.PRE.1